MEYNSSIMYKSLYNDFLEDKIYNENRLNLAINEQLIVTESSTTLKQKSNELTALYEAKLSDFIINSWNSFVDWINSIFARFMEKVNSILLNNKKYLEKYQNIILFKKSKIEPLNIPGDYTLGIDRCFKTIIPTFQYNDKFKEALQAEGDMEALKLIINDSSLKYDNGRSVTEVLKDYFMGKDKGNFTKKWEELNRREIYNFCSNAGNIKNLYNKDIAHLKSSTNAIKSAINRELKNTSADKEVQNDGKAKQQQTTNPQQKTTNNTTNQTQANNNNNQQKTNTQNNINQQNNTNNNQQQNINASFVYTEADNNTINSNAVQSSYASKGKPTDNQKQTSANNAVNDAVQKADINAMTKKWISVCRMVITAKMTAQQTIARFYMNAIRSHVQSYVGRLDKAEDNVENNDQSADFQTNTDDNGNTTRNVQHNK